MRIVNINDYDEFRDNYYIDHKGVGLKVAYNIYTYDKDEEHHLWEEFNSLKVAYERCPSCVPRAIEPVLVYKNKRYFAGFLMQHIEGRRFWDYEEKDEEEKQELLHETIDKLQAVGVMWGWDDHYGNILVEDETNRVVAIDFEDIDIEERQ